MASNTPPSGSQSHWPPPASGSMTPQSYASPYSMQFHPGAPQLHQYAPQPNQQFHPAGQSQNIGIPGQNQPPFSQPVQQYHPRPMQQYQLSMPMASSPGQPQPAAQSHGAAFASPYPYGQSSFGLPQNGINLSSQFQHSPWLQANQNASVVGPLQQALQAAGTAPAASGSTIAQTANSDWQEYEAADGRRYFYNKITKQSSWEKPAELMSSVEKADALTVWKEFTTPEGRKYYYNKETKQSKWSIPDELKLAREQAGDDIPEVPTAASGSSELTSTAVELSSTMATIAGATSSHVTAPVGSEATASNVVVLEPTAVTPIHNVSSTVVGISPIGEKVASSCEVAGTSGVPVSSDNSTTSAEDSSSKFVVNSSDVASMQDMEEAKKGMAAAGKINETPIEDKIVEDEPFLYASKQEAKNAFKALLESANVGADWSWDQAMRVIINDKRYGALKSLGERKQAFNEYLMQRKKVEAEERRLRHRKAKEDFVKMLEDSEKLTSSMRWSNAARLFEDDLRFKAVEYEGDREDLFRTYLVDLQKKEKAKAQEEYRKNRLEFRQFLEGCSFIKVDSQWRKVQDLLEENDQCTRLNKIERLDIFQDYIRDLEKEEDEQKKRQKEQLKRTERKNRDAFRKMMEEHIGDGSLTAKTHWRDYFQKVKDSEAYEAVATNTSGSTPKELFEDVYEELEKKYDEDKARIKDALKLEKISITSSWTFEEFKSSTKGSTEKPSISDINLQLVYEELIDRAKEKEEKEAKKRKRLAKEFNDRLSATKEITESCTWDECKKLTEDTSEYRFMGEESLCMEVFDEYVSRMQEKKDKERKREEDKAKREKEREEKEKKKEKEKDKKEKDKDKDKDHEKEKEKKKDHSKKDETESDTMDVVESHGHKDERKREKDRDRKHRKRHQNDDVTSDKDDKEETKRSRRHGSDRKKSRKHGYSSESDSESRHKKHKRDHRDGSRRSGHDELEDGEVGEDGEIQQS